MTDFLCDVLKAKILLSWLVGWLVGLGWVGLGWFKVKVGR
jgi:hypothetical protein